MSRCCTRSKAQISGDAVQTASPSAAKRCGRFAGWVVPSVGLVLIPKCPMCLAGYIALATGIGLSVPTATYLRFSLIALCIGALVFLAGRQAFRFLRWRKVH